MKILYLQKRDAGGGAKVSLDLMLKYLRKDIDYEVMELSYGYKPFRRKNLLVFGLWLLKLPLFLLEYYRAYQYSKGFDLVHINHDSLFVYGLLPVPVVMHMRVMCPDNIYVKLQCWIIDKTVDHLIFISLNEVMQFGKILGKCISTKWRVIYNAAFF